MRFADLRRLAPEDIGDKELRGLLEHLLTLGFLRRGRPGEWRSGLELAPLADEHEIYSNISSEALGASIVDAYSGRPIARAERPRTRGEASVKKLRNSSV